MTFFIRISGNSTLIVNTWSRKADFGGAARECCYELQHRRQMDISELVPPISLPSIEISGNMSHRQYWSRKADFGW